MPELLTLTNPQTTPNVVTWKIKAIHFDVDIPYIKIDFKSNTGLMETFRLVPDEITSANEINAGLLFIDRGNFMVIQGKSLRKWLTEQAILKGFKLGTVTGVAE